MKQLFNFVDSFLQTLFGRARDMEVQRRVLSPGQCLFCPVAYSSPNGE